MTDIITAKDLTKNELSGAKILAAFVILAGLGMFLNSALMEHKDLPEISFTALPTQTVDGSGLVSFGVNLNKLSDYNTKLKIEYSLDGESYAPIGISALVINTDYQISVGDNTYQIVEINSDSDTANINFVWDTMATAGNVSSQKARIKITLAYDLKNKSAENNNETATPDIVLDENSTENSEVKINDDEVTIGENVIIDSNQNLEDQPASDLPAVQPSAEVNSDSVSADAETTDTPTNILPQSPEEINTLIAAFADTAGSETGGSSKTENADADIWSELSMISDKFEVDNLAPEIKNGQINMDKASITLNFTEPMKTEYMLNSEQTKLQAENLSESTFSWLNDLTLIIGLSASEKEKFIVQTDDLILEIGNSNLQDLFGNKFNGGQIVLEKKTDEITEPEDEKDEEVKNEEEPKPEQEIIVPGKIDKVINIRGYNQTCSFSPEELTMSAGETGQATVTLTPRDPDSTYILTANTLSNDFAIKILQPSGMGTGPINLEINVPENALPRLYKLLIKYQDILPQSVSYVNNCVLRLTVQ